MVNKILLLGVDKENQLFNFLKSQKKTLVDIKDTTLSLIDANKYDLIVSYGYKKIIPNKIITALNRPIINLHISYLPFNRGAHPNFWAFAENTISGVTIHEIDSNIDTGNIIYQKKIYFDLIKNKKSLTFENTHQILSNEIENLFIKNYKDIFNYQYECTRQIRKGSFHFKKDLPLIIKSWSQNIYDTIEKYNQSKN